VHPFTPLIPHYYTLLYFSTFTKSGIPQLWLSLVEVSTFPFLYFYTIFYQTKTAFGSCLLFLLFHLSTSLLFPFASNITFTSALLYFSTFLLSYFSTKPSLLPALTKHVISFSTTCYIFPFFYFSTFLLIPFYTLCFLYFYTSLIFPFYTSTLFYFSTIFVLSAGGPALFLSC